MKTLLLDVTEFSDIGKKPVARKETCLTRLEDAVLNGDKYFEDLVKSKWADEIHPIQGLVTIPGKEYFEKNEKISALEHKMKGIEQNFKDLEQDNERLIRKLEVAQENEKAEAANNVALRLGLETMKDGFERKMHSVTTNYKMEVYELKSQMEELKELIKEKNLEIALHRQIAKEQIEKAQKGK